MGFEAAACGDLGWLLLLGVELFCFAGGLVFASVGFCLWFGGLFVALLLVGLGLWLFIGWFDLMWIGPRCCGGGVC